MTIAHATADPALPAKQLTADDFVGDLIQPGHPLFGLVWVNPDRMGGVPCFTGTRVPVQTLFDHVAAGDPLDVFLDDFLGVTRAQAVAVINASRTRLLDGALGLQ